MTKDDIQLLFQYNRWANNRVFESVSALSIEQFTRDLGSSFKSVRDTFAHLYGAQWIWLERWHGRVPSGFPAPADFPDLETTRRKFTEIDSNLVDYAASLNADDIQRVIEFKSMAGTHFAQPLWQMLQHVANHSTYHRGQIATMLRQLGSKATSTDLIAFYRERGAAKAGA